MLSRLAPQITHCQVNFVFTIRPLLLYVSSLYDATIVIYPPGLRLNLVLSRLVRTRVTGKGAHKGPRFLIFRGTVRHCVRGLSCTAPRGGYDDNTGIDDIVLIDAQSSAVTFIQVARAVSTPLHVRKTQCHGALFQRVDSKAFCRYLCPNHHLWAAHHVIRHRGLHYPEVRRRVLSCRSCCFVGFVSTF